MPVTERDPSAWEAATIPTARGAVHVRRRMPPGAGAVVAMVGGVGGGFDTPGRDLYPRLAEDLAQHGVGTLRVRFRDPRSLDDAIHDLAAALASLAAGGVRRVGLVGHSFGGAVVLRAALASPTVAGVVTLATQSAGTDGVEHLGRPVLLLHGDADPVLPWRASADVARRVGEHAELQVLAGSRHDLVEHRDEVRLLVRDWLLDVLAGPRSA